MAQFQILSPYSASDWRPVTIEFNYAPHGDQQYLWSSFEDAQAALQRLVERAPDVGFRVALVGAEVGDLDWQIREKLRFADDTYLPTPWHDELWYQSKHEAHFCHVSMEQAGKIAFTENAAKGAMDRQLVMSPGRYLNRFFCEHLDNNAIEGWCARLSVQLQEDTLKITQDADEIEEVYAGGPSSCMAHTACDFGSSCHPTRVYAGPDTALAYIGSREDAKARSVIWPSRKIYTRIYGDVSRLKLLLEGAGYTEGSLNGARIRRIEDDDHFVVPYIDAGGDLADDGEYLVIGHGSISCESTTGLANDPWYCPHCDSDGSPYDSVYLSGGGYEEWCYSCFHNHSTFCEHNECHYSDDENFITVYADDSSHSIIEEDAVAFGAVYLEDRCQWWISRCCRQCDGSGGWFHAEDLTEYHGEWLSDDHLPEPLDDDDTYCANAHILAYRQFHDEMAAIHADVAKWQAAGERARAARLECERDEAARLRREALLHDVDKPQDRACSQGADHPPPRIAGNSFPTIAMTAPLYSAAASQAGA